MFHWTDKLPDWIVALWTALAFWIGTNIEPMPGVWVAAFFGSSLSGMTGRDRTIGAFLIHFILGLLVGVAFSQIIGEVINIHAPISRVGFSFFAALFSEKIVAGIGTGEIFKGLLPWRRT